MDGVAATTDFSMLFREYLVNGAAHALSQVRAITDLVRRPTERETVLHLLDFALDFPPTTAIGVEILHRLTPAMEQAGLWEDWIPYLAKGIEQCRRSGEVGSQAQLHFYLGQVYQLQSKFAKAREEQTVSTTLFDSVGDRPRQAKALNRLAYLARLEHHYADANGLVEQALSLLPAEDAERSFSYFVQGAIAFDKKAWSDAVHYFKQSLTISEAQGDKLLIARRLRNLGPALRALGAYTEAIACYERAIQLFAEVHDPVQAAVTHMNFGVVYLQLDQPDQALVHFAQAEPVFRSVQDRWHLAMVYTNQGIAHRMQASWIQAQQCFDTGIALWQQLGNRASQVNALDELGLVYLEQGCVDQAKLIFQRALDLLDKLPDDPAYAVHLAAVTEHMQRATALPLISNPAQEEGI